MAFSVAVLVAIQAPGSLPEGLAGSDPAPGPTIVRGELRPLQLPIGTEGHACVDIYFSDGAAAMRCDGPDWRMTNPDPAHPVASVDAKGKVSALAAGQATLSVSYRGLTLSAPCTVTDPAVRTLQITTPYPTIDEGSTATFRAAAEYEKYTFKDVVRGVRWTVTDVEPAKQVAIIDQDGRVRGLRSGMAEIRATYLGHTASTMLSVVAPSKASPDPVRILGLKPRKWRRLCMARLRRIWIPRLRALPEAKVELKDTGDRDFGLIRIAVKQATLAREISIHWSDDCDAGGPTSGWTPDGFDGRSPSAPVEHILAAAGYDCLAYIP